jgi:hypothetical protein
MGLPIRLLSSSNLIAGTQDSNGKKNVHKK